MTATGPWINDRTHGQQYKAKFLKTSAPHQLLEHRQKLWLVRVQGRQDLVRGAQVKAPPIGDPDNIAVADRAQEGFRREALLEHVERRGAREKQPV
jgi:hypothetical protein